MDRCYGEVGKVRGKRVDEGVGLPGFSVTDLYSSDD